MPVEQYSNGVTTTITGSLAAGDGSATFADVGQLPSSGYYRGRLDDELIGVTAGSTTTRPIERGLEGTTPTSHVAGTTFKQLLTAGGLDNLVSVYNAGTLLGNKREINLVAPLVGSLNGSRVDVAITGLKEVIRVEFDGRGSVIGAGSKVDYEVPYAGSLTAARLLADQSGSVAIDVWRAPYADYPPVDGSSIVGTATYAISSATKFEDTALTGWTKTFSAGDVLRFNVDSCTTITRVTASLTLVRT